DRRRWSLDEDGEYTVKELSRMIEEKILRLDNGGQETLWNTLVAKKVNIFMWKALREVFRKKLNWWKVRRVTAFSIDEFFSSNGYVNVPILLARVCKRSYGLSAASFSDVSIFVLLLSWCLTASGSESLQDQFEEYLRRPSLEDIEKTYALHEEKHGLPAMLGIIDCMHWDWKNCLKALHGQFKRRYHKYPALMLEAVPDQKLWI
ncbi:RNA-directed DNA polymerase, eukaryota, reverse transcriptase zinc-binding domain protein, partial [Tanacetum coccineum]